MSKTKSKINEDLFRTDRQLTTVRFMLIGSTWFVTAVNCRLQVDPDVEIEGLKVDKMG